MTNRLARESSPYLLQHAHNPVDWYPWGEEAFAAARAQDKPIFLSVGYSTCYWCHVMERESFESDATAAAMNELFINIKVDREERPDVDQLYMTAVQVLSGHGGWPMSVFLMPDLRPFYGGTYFPPQDMHGRAGFATVLRAVSDAYKSRRDEIDQSASQLTGVLQRLAAPAPPGEPITIGQSLIGDLIRDSISEYDPVNGGFGTAPKFPRETLLELLLQSQSTDRKPQIDQMLRHTLDAMANGGIRDHLGGGFHRYSTDAKWLVPHFEIMLYDNAMLGWIYVEASHRFGDQRYARVARGICDFVVREMTDPRGGFYTAIDAEVDSHEGQNYLWTRAQIEQVLSKDQAMLFCAAYGVDRGPNFADPHHGRGVPQANVLYLSDPAAETDPQLVNARRKLLEARKQRKQPALDNKIITSWNALMIRALAHAGKVLGAGEYLEAARKGGQFLLRNHVDEFGVLHRTSRDGRVGSAGFLDDYAFLIQALLALDEATGTNQFHTDAQKLADAMTTRFSDSSGGFYFTDANAPDVIVRQKTATDSPLPSGNAIAAMVLRELGNSDASRNVIAAFAGQLTSNADSMSAMLQAALKHVHH
ncbi:MAG: thioredoxin domain-containing protein, partial [Tepidisphaeraceae bacterium]